MTENFHQLSLCWLYFNWNENDALCLEPNHGATLLQPTGICQFTSGQNGTGASLLELSLRSERAQSPKVTLNGRVYTLPSYLCPGLRMDNMPYGLYKSAEGNNKSVYLCGHLATADNVCTPRGPLSHNPSIKESRGLVCVGTRSGSWCSNSDTLSTQAAHQRHGSCSFSPPSVSTQGVFQAQYSV